MAAPSGGFRALTIELAVAAAVAAILAALYIYYGLGRSELLTQRNYRVLAALSQQLSDRIGGRREAITARERFDAFRQAQYKRCDIERNLSGLNPKVDAAKDGVTVILITQPNWAPRLWLRYRRQEDSQGLAASSPAAGCEAESKGTAIEEPNSGGEAQSSRAGPTAATDQQRIRTPACKSAEQTLALDTFGVAQLMHNVLAGGDSRIFDAVLLSTPSGEVVFQQGIQGIDTIGHLIAGEDSTTAAKSSGKTEVDASGSAGAGTAHWWASSAQVHYRGEDYWILSVPTFAAAVASGPEEPSAAVAAPVPLLLSAMIRKGNQASQAQQLPAFTLTALLLFLMLCLFMWPILRLWSMKAGERLRVRHVRILALCFLATAGTLTLFIVYIPFIWILTASLDRQLQTLSGLVGSRFRQELNANAQRLEKPDQIVHQPVSACDAIDLQRLSRFTVWKAHRDGEGSDNNGLVSIDSWKMQPDCMNFSQTPLFVRVNNRSYFKDVQADNLAFEGSSSQRPGAAPRFAAEVVRARNTGNFSLVVARRMAIKPNPEISSVVWIALSKLTPFLNPVVPDSFGFAILDAQGDIQIHSVMDRSLQENLFRECENDQELKSAVWARRSQWVTTRYYGDKYRMYLSPIKGTPFSAVTFYNAHMVHVVASDIVSAWLFDSILYGFAYVVLLLAVELVAPGYRADWLWPSRSASIVPLYWWVIPFLAIAAVYSLAVLPALDGWPKVAMTAVIPASIVALLCLTFGNAGTPLATWERRIATFAALAGSLVTGVVLWLFGMHWLCAGPVLVFTAVIGLAVKSSRGRDRPGPRIAEAREGEFRLAYNLMLLFLVLNLAAVPSVVFFEDAKNQEMSNLVKEGQLSWIESMTRRATRIRQEIEDAFPDGSQSDRQRLVANRVSYGLDRYPAQWLVNPIVGPWLSARTPNADDAGSIESAPTHWSMAALYESVAQKAGFFSDKAESSKLGNSSHANQSVLAEMTYQASADGSWHWSPGRDRWLEISLPDFKEILGRSATNGKLWDGIEPPDPSSAGGLVALIAAIGIAIALLVLSIQWSVTQLLFLLDADCKLPEVKAPAGSPDAVLTSLGVPEKLALAHLALEGFLSPADERVAHELFDKELIERRPAFAITDNALKELVLKISAPESVRQWERESMGNGSSLVGIPLLVLLLIAIAFLLGTQPGSFGSALALMPALLAAVPAILSAATNLGVVKKGN